MTFQITTVYPDGRKEVRDATPEEVAQREADIAAEQERQEAEAVAAAERATKKAALLDKLGITEEEAKLLLS